MPLQTQAVKIEAHSLEDKAAGRHIWLDVAGVATGLAKITHIGVLEHGMVSGATSISALAETENGDHYFIELSLELLKSITAAAIGIDTRWAWMEAEKIQDQLRKSDPDAV